MRIASQSIGFAVFFALFAAGCKEETKTVIVKGKLMMNGAPYERAKTEMPYLKFVPYSEEGKVDNIYSANLQDDGTFDVRGRENKGIPLGKYRIAFSTDRRGVEKLSAKFTESASPIVRDITDDKEIVIDLSNPSGS